MDVVADPLRRQRYVFAEHDDMLEIQIEIDPGGEVPPHLHPVARERFEVLEGEVTFEVGREKLVARAGDVAEVEPGIRHRFLNRSGSLARMKAEVQPKGRLRANLEEAAALARAGRMTRRGMPRSPGAVVDLAAFVKRYDDTTVVLSPPPFMQRLLYPLARLRRG